MQRVQEWLADSVRSSPCAGPNIDLLNIVEDGWGLLEQQEEHSTMERLERTKSMLDYLSSLPTVLPTAVGAGGDSSKDLDIHQVRILYIPTAMYALRSDSTSSPGKQRQRARADGKKRRTQVIRLVEELFASDDEEEDGGGLNVNVLAITLDLHDGSLKQPQGSDDSTLFPKVRGECIFVFLGTCKERVITLTMFSIS